MNLVAKLLKADAKKTEELEKKIIHSKRLGKIVGEEVVEITIQEIPARRMNDIMAYQIDEKGKFDITKSFDAKALSLVEGVVDPPVKNSELIEHFGCTTPKDLVVKLFGNEITEISDEITMLSGIQNEVEEEIKN